jgi:lipoate-protein ligase A
MKVFDHSFSTPAENLACDEALLDFCEAGYDHEILRFWESHDPFVVLGYSNKLDREVYQETCRKDNVPILRRCTGGGTVIQGPGCLNYALVLKIPEDGPLTGITSTNAHIITQHQKALQKVLGNGVIMQGLSDLAVNDLKFSGNAQRRKRSHILFHGTFLIDFDLPLVERLLPMPSRQPDYRKNRPHEEFLTNISLAKQQIKQAIQAQWAAREILTEVPTALMTQHVKERYGNDGWNLKF